jgi:hypothetical protein
MANELARSGQGPTGGALKKTAGGAMAKKHAKKAAKHAAKKHEAKHAAKHAKKAAKHVHVPGASIDGRDEGLRTAFHHMQRASVVVSLMEKGTGEDLRDLLARGVKLYSKASEEGGEKTLLKSIGLLRAAEHLALAGLYTARHKHRQKVAEPRPEWLAELIAGTNGRLENVADGERGKGPDLFPVTVEMLRQAEEADHDPHLAYELAMAADALCFALENGL